MKKFKLKYQKLLTSGIVTLFLIVGFLTISSVEAYQFQVSDNLTGSSISDINTDYWDWWQAYSSGSYGINNNGFTLSGGWSYLGTGTGLNPDFALENTKPFQPVKKRGSSVNF